MHIMHFSTIGITSSVLLIYICLFSFDIKIFQWPPQNDFPWFLTIVCFVFWSAYLLRVECVNMFDWFSRSCTKSRHGAHWSIFDKCLPEINKTSSGPKWVKSNFPFSPNNPFFKMQKLLTLGGVKMDNFILPWIFQIWYSKSRHSAHWSIFDKCLPEIGKTSSGPK